MKKRAQSVAKILSLTLTVISVLVILFQTEEDPCAKTETWNLNEFTIEHYKCSSGPVLQQEQTWIYTNGQKISEKGVRISGNDCYYEFAINKEYHIKADVCKRTIKELKPNKKEIVTSEIDSAYISTMFSKKKKRLLNKHIELLSTKWKNSKPNYHKFPSSSTPTLHKYKITLFTENKTRELFITSHVIREKGDWQYASKTRDEIFDQIWKESIK